MMKRLIPQLLLIATTSLIANAQTPEQNINVTIRPSQTVEEKVANEIKERELKKEAEEKLAAEEAATAVIAAQNRPAARLQSQERRTGSAIG